MRNVTGERLRCSSRRLRSAMRASLILCGTTCATVVELVSPAGATVPTVTPTILGSVLAAEETPTFEVSRDVGQSAALPSGQSLWLFGDTESFTDASGTWTAVPNSYIDGSTSAQGGTKAGTNPTGLGEVLVGDKELGDTPQQLIPSPTDVYNPDPSIGGSCSASDSSDGTTIAYPARWPSGAAMMPNKRDVLISYTDVCVLTGGTAVTEGWGFMEMNYKTHAITVGPDDVIPPQPPTKSGGFGSDQIAPQYQFASPLVDPSGSVIFTSAECGGYTIGVCNSGSGSNSNVWSTTVKATTKDLEDFSDYSTPTADTTADGTSWAPSSDNAAVASYPGVGYLLFELTSIYGSFDVYSSAKPTGGWTEIAGGELAGCPSAPGFCYALVGHPELSDSSEVEISYVLPGYGPDPNVNHLVAATIPITG
jgi:hypothetical protein